MLHNQVCLQPSVPAVGIPKTHCSYPRFQVVSQHTFEVVMLLTNWSDLEVRRSLTVAHDHQQALKDLPWTLGQSYAMCVTAAEQQDLRHTWFYLREQAVPASQGAEPHVALHMITFKAWLNSQVTLMQLNVRLSNLVADLLETPPKDWHTKLVRSFPFQISLQAVSEQDAQISHTGVEVQTFKCRIIGR